MACSGQNGCCGSENHDSEDQAPVTPRRTFLKWFSGILAAPLAAFTIWPMIGSIIGTVFRVPRARFIEIGQMSDFPEGKPVQHKFEMPRHEGYLRGTILHEVWVIRHSDGTVTVFSPICPHLGCHYDWFPSAEKFICPCHGSVFAEDGKVLGGPAPRALDRLPYKIESGKLYVKWERFEVGIPQKVRVG